MDRDPFDLVGSTLDGQFRVLALAGSGDLSVVYKGHSIGVDAPVAIKCLDLPTTLDGALVRPLADAFRDASRLHCKLSQGNLSIVRGLASGSSLAPGTGMILPYLVREWLEGESLAVELVRRRTEGQRGRPVEEVVALLDPVADAVGYAHGQGSAHLSLNPSNLFLSDRAGARSLKVLDFGVSRAMNDVALTIPPGSRPPGMRALFPAYAAPEQLDAGVGKVGAWTDVYALALLMMELLSDRVVMAGPDLMQRALDEKQRPTAQSHGLELAKNLELVLTRAVARAPERRQKTAKDFWSDVKTALRGATSRGMTFARAPARPAPAEAAAVSAPSPVSEPVASVAGAVPGRRLLVPAMRRPGTIPMGFDPLGVSGPTYVPLPQPAVETAKEQEPDLPPVHVVATPPPPQAATPALPPVIVALDTPPPALAQPPPPPFLPPTPPLPPPVPQSPTFPIIEYAAPRNRRTGALVLTLIAAVVGSSAGVGAVIFVKRRHPASATMVVPASVSPAPAASPLPASSAAPPASASASSSSASASASPSASVSAPAADTAGQLPVAPLAHFPAAAAKHALDAASHDIVHCKRGKVWGIASADVTFGNDGAISHIAVGIPFTGTTTGQCVSDALSVAKVPPYAGKLGVVTYRFVIPPK